MVLTFAMLATSTPTTNFVYAQEYHDIEDSIETTYTFEEESNQENSDLESLPKMEVEKEEDSVIEQIFSTDIAVEQELENDTKKYAEESDNSSTDSADTNIEMEEIISADADYTNLNTSANDVFKSVSWEKGVFRNTANKSGYAMYLVEAWNTDTEEWDYITRRDVNLTADYPISVDFQMDIADDLQESFKGQVITLRIKYSYSNTPLWEEDEATIEKLLRTASSMEDTFLLATQKLPTPKNVKWIGKTFVWESDESGNVGGYEVGFNGMSQYTWRSVSSDYRALNFSDYIDDYQDEDETIYATVRMKTNDLTVALPSDSTEPEYYDSESTLREYCLYNITNNKVPIEGCQYVDWETILHYFNDKSDEPQNCDYEIVIFASNKEDPITNLPSNVNSLKITNQYLGYTYVTDDTIVLSSNTVINRPCLLATAEFDGCNFDLNGYNLISNSHIYGEVFDSSKEKKGTLTLLGGDYSLYCKNVRDINEVIIDCPNCTVSFSCMDNIKNLIVRSPLLICPVSKYNNYSLMVDNLICEDGGQLWFYDFGQIGQSKLEYDVLIHDSAMINVNRVSNDGNGYYDNPTPFSNGFKLFQYNGDISNIKYAEDSAILKAYPDAGFSQSGGYVIGANNPIAKDLFEGISAVPSAISMEAQSNGLGQYTIVDDAYDADKGLESKLVLSKESFDKDGQIYYPKVKAVVSEEFEEWDNDIVTVTSKGSTILSKYKGNKLGAATIGVMLDYTVDEDGNYSINCMDKDGQDTTILLTFKEVNVSALERVYPITISVVGAYTEAEKQSLLASIKYDRSESSNQAETDYILAYVVGNGRNTLRDAKLCKEGVAETNSKNQGTFTWVNENQVLAADSNRKGYYCTLKFTPNPEGDYAQYPSFTTTGFVAVSKFTGIYITADNDKYTLDSNLENDAVDLKVNFMATGYFDLEDTPFFQTLGAFIGEDSDGQLLWEDLSGKGYLSIDVDSEVMIHAKACIKDNRYIDGFSNKIRATLTDATGKTYVANNSLTLVKGAITKIDLAEAKTEADEKINTFIHKEKAPALNKNEGDEYYSLNLSTSVIKRNIDNNNKLVSASITVDATAYAGDSVNVNTKLIWSSSDTGIVTVKAVDAWGRRAVITFGSKTAGNATITVKSADKASTIAQIYVQEEDHSPVQPSNKIALNAFYNGTNPLAIPMKAQEGTKIVSVAVTDKNYTDYSIEKINGQWSIKSPQKNSPSYPVKKYSDNNFVLKVGVQADESEEIEYYELKYVLTVSRDRPTAIVKQISKPNIFYTDSKASYTITSKYPMESVRVFAPKADGGYEELRGDQYSVIVHANGLSASVSIQDRDIFASKVKLHFEIIYAGYDIDTKTITKASAVATMNKKPTVSFAQIDVPAGENTGKTHLLVDKARRNLTDMETVKAVVESKVAIEKSPDGMIKIENTTGKTQNYKAKVKLSNWSEAIVVSGKYNIVKQPELVLETNNITMNVANNYQDNGYIEIPINIKNSPVSITGLTYDISAAKNAKLFSNNILRVVYNKNDSKLKIGFNKESDAYANLAERSGSYSIPFTAKTNYGDSKAATLTINVDKNAISVSVFVKGSLNTVDRANGPALTFKLADASTGVYVADMKLKNPKVNGDFAASGVADFFYVAKEGAKRNQDIKVPATIGAYWSASLDIKQSYQMGAVITLSDGTVLELDGVSKGKIISIKPVQKLPKMTLSKSTIHIYKKALEDIEVSMVPAYGSIETAVRQGNDKNYRDITVGFTEAIGENLAFLILRPTEQIKNTKAGKYTITIKYTLRGQAINTAPQTAKITASVNDIKLLDLIGEN